jgi:hypothetical protein
VEPRDRRRAADVGDLGRHRLTAVADVERGAVLVDGPVHRVDGDQLEVVVHLGAGRLEAVPHQPGHGEHRRTRVEPVAAELEPPGSTAGAVAPLEDHDVVGAREATGRGQAAEPGTDDDHLHAGPPIGSISARER